jgi:hypothetical protein
MSVERTDTSFGSAKRLASEGGPTSRERYSRTRPRENGRCRASTRFSDRCNGSFRRWHCHSLGRGREEANFVIQTVRISRADHARGCPELDRVGDHVAGRVHLTRAADGKLESRHEERPRAGIFHTDVASAHGDRRADRNAIGGKQRKVGDLRIRIQRLGRRRDRFDRRSLCRVAGPVPFARKLRKQNSGQGPRSRRVGSQS